VVPEEEPEADRQEAEAEVAGWDAGAAEAEVAGASGAPCAVIWASD
jgi:hypothetical protein